MPRILVLCHGDLAEALINTSRLILGDISDRVRFMNLSPNHDMERYYEDIKRHIVARKEEGGVLILTDIMGGSPFLNAAKIYYEFREEECVEIVTGVNLPMLLDTIGRVDSADLKTLKKTAIAEGTAGIKDFTEVLQPVGNSSDGGR